MAKIKLKDLVKKVNADNAPPDGWSPKDAVAADKPEAGKVYAFYLVCLLLWPGPVLAVTGVLVLSLVGAF